MYISAFFVIVLYFTGVLVASNWNFNNSDSRLIIFVSILFIGTSAFTVIVTGLGTVNCNAFLRDSGKEVEIFSATVVLATLFCTYLIAAVACLLLTKLGSWDSYSPELSFLATKKALK